MDTLILGALLGSVVIGFTAAVADLRRKKKSADLLCAEYADHSFNKDQEITDLKKQIETLRNCNKLLSLEFDSANKEIRKLREFNTILQNDYNELRKELNK